MMFLCGQSNRVWHYWAGKYPGSVGLLVGPSYGTKVPIDPWMPFALDNDAFGAFKKGTEWSAEDWRSFIQRIRLLGRVPLWCAIPDVVGKRFATLARWQDYSREILDLGWPAAICVQDGMTPADVPSEASVIFVGGTDGWKFRNLPMWTNNFERVHCGRVTSPAMFEVCESLGCESIDGTGWFMDPSRQDKLPAIERFLEGHRNRTPVMI